VPEDAKQQLSTTMLNCRLRILFRICFNVLPPYIPLIHRTKTDEVLSHHYTEQNPKTSVAYLNDFEHISCDFESVVV